MTLGYDKPLYLLAFDHRGSFEHYLFHASRPISEEVRAGIVDAKDLIFEPFAGAVRREAPREAAGVLVDEKLSANVARTSIGSGFVPAMPVERSGQADVDFEHGEEHGRHIAEFDPTFAKVLVRYNPYGDDELNQRQTEPLAKPGTWLHDRDRKLLFELLVPPTPDQLKRVGGYPGRYDREIRPDLVVEIVRTMQEGGVEPHSWKIEGLDSHQDCEMVVAQARKRAKAQPVSFCCEAPMRLGSSNGFKLPPPSRDSMALKVGRTLREDPMRRFVAGTASRAGSSGEGRRSLAPDNRRFCPSLVRIA